jgi:SlyX protein
MSPAMTNEDYLENRLTELEIKFTRQDDLLEQLNNVIYAQQKQIDELNKKIKVLESKPALTPVNEPPPHY